MGILVCDGSRGLSDAQKERKSYFFAELRDGFRSKAWDLGRKMSTSVRKQTCFNPKTKYALSVGGKLSTHTHVFRKCSALGRVGEPNFHSGMLFENFGWFNGGSSPKAGSTRPLNEEFNNFRGRKARSLFFLHADVRMFCSFRSTEFLW